MGGEMNEKGVEGGKIRAEFGGYFGLCTVGGILSAGTTHVAVTPLDVLKVNMQVLSLPLSSFCLFVFLVATSILSYVIMGFSGCNLACLLLLM